jgi:hypothetical protein
MTRRISLDALTEEVVRSSSDVFAATPTREVLVREGRRLPGFSGPFIAGKEQPPQLVVELASDDPAELLAFYERMRELGFGEHLEPIE